MKKYAFSRYKPLLALAIALVGVGLIMHFAERPEHLETTYQTRVDMPESHHTYLSARRAGDEAPLFELQDHAGESFNLKKALREGPVVLTFFRGNWCPLCAAHLKILEGIKPEVEVLGGRLVALSAQTPAKTAETQEKFGISFPVLSDQKMAVTKAYGVDWQIPEKDRAAFADWLDKSTGQRLNEYQVTGEYTSLYTLPVPATYVIAPTGDIVYAHVDDDYKNRAEPNKILEALTALKTEH